VTLRAPFPWYGGKSRAAHLIWPRFGDVPNYVEPFAGSLAVLLARPHEPRTETVNDKDAYLSNFWRSLQADPEDVCHYCDWPVTEADLHARHAWLQAQAPFRERMIADPEFYDVKVAGWWVWGLCCWIGGEWCSPKAMTWRERPVLAAGGRGVTRTWERLPEITCNRGIHKTTPALLEALVDLSARLRRVRVCCGDFARVLTTSATTLIGTTAVLIDPPYSAEAGRDSSIYNEEDLGVAHRAREWALEHGGDPRLRIALCGYEGEHAMPPEWECVVWASHGGTQRNANNQRERIWFSPHCLDPRERLFEQVLQP
jgi:hypothetical protein